MPATYYLYLFNTGLDISIAYVTFAIWNSNYGIRLNNYWIA